MNGSALFTLDQLTVTYATRHGLLRAVDSISLSIAPGETVALVGESGSGKSTVALAAMGLLGPEARVTGSVQLGDQELLSMPPDALRQIRGAAMSVVFQDPFSSLNPALPIGLQVAEPLIYHRGMGAEAARERVVATLTEVGLPSPAELLAAFPHQLSGGMQQRVLIATALVCDPALIILDEPTTALDVTVEARILDLLQQIKRQRNLSMLFITHNLGVVERIADRVCVLYAGRIVEAGEKAAVLHQPYHPYTKGLLACLPRLAANESRRRLSSIPGRLPDLTQPVSGCIFAARCVHAEARCESEEQALSAIGAGSLVRCWKAGRLQERPRMDEPHEAAVGKNRVPVGQGLVVENLAKTYRVKSLRGDITWRRRFGVPLPSLAVREVRAVDGVSLVIRPGEVLGLVGESGSGKSTLGRLVLRLINATEGRVLFDGVNVFEHRPRDLQTFRSRAQIVFQNPDSSLNPRRTIGQAVARAIELHRGVAPQSIPGQVGELLERVGLPRAYAARYPHQLSGGEKQRAGIARALATAPSFLVCDEPVSALDVSVQATVLNLLADLRDEFGLSYLFISHDLAVVAHLADRIAVMFAGQIVELGSTRAVLQPPYHPYTHTLFSAVARANGGGTVLQGDEAAARPMVDRSASGGCPFNTRCPRRIGAICDTERPSARPVGDGHAIACHLPLLELTSFAHPDGAARHSAH